MKLRIQAPEAAFEEAACLLLAGIAGFKCYGSVRGIQPDGRADTPPAREGIDQKRHTFSHDGHMAADQNSLMRVR